MLSNSKNTYLNQLVSQQAGGPLQFKGSLNEAGTVTLDGSSATVNGDNTFRGTVSASASVSETGRS